ncbi:unnamed protein product [Rhizoctonia solani]|uniref:Zn(2)-C6 fungal-type domain-containing protein n=1 Tax=Rhizoctonia solani TaxID=456999 RepID=A0A8H3CT41_9AGAM|nr:unnamed protein product [Rhizoctonia solani]
MGLSQPYFGSTSNPFTLTNVVSPMLNASNAGCVNCRARNKKCDLTRGPNGCRRCDRAGIECGGYLETGSRAPRLKHSSRGTHGNHPGPINQDGITLPIGHSAPNQPSRLAEKGFIIPTLDDRELIPDSLDRRSDISYPTRYTNLSSYPTVPHGQLLMHPAGRAHGLSTGRDTGSIVQMPTPPFESTMSIGAPRTRPGGPMTPGQASLFDSLFSLANDSPVLPHTPDSPGLNVILCHSTEGESSADIILRQTSASDPQSELIVNQSEELENSGHEDRELSLVPVELLDELALDREVESNVMSFVAHSFMLWIRNFIFESTRAISFARETIVRGRMFGKESHQRLILVAKTVFTLSKSTDYDLTHFTTLYKLLTKGVLEVRACRDLTREAAMKAMESCHEVSAFNDV